MKETEKKGNVINFPQCYPNRFSQEGNMDINQLSLTSIRALLIADHSGVRAVLSLLIESHPRFVLAGVADNCSEGIAIAGQELPDIILLNISPDNSKAFDEVEKLHSSLNRTCILVLTSEHDPALYRRAAELGMIAFVSKEEGPEALIEAIENAHAGKTVWHKKV